MNNDRLIPQGLGIGFATLENSNSTSLTFLIFLKHPPLKWKIYIPKKENSLSLTHWSSIQLNAITAKPDGRYQNQPLSSSLLVCQPWSSSWLLVSSMIGSVLSPFIDTNRVHRTIFTIHLHYQSPASCQCIHRFR